MALYRIAEETNLLSRDILDAAFHVHSTLGPGLLESVYEECLAHVLTARGLKVERQVILPIAFDGIVIRSGLKLDLLVADDIIVELKAVEKILPIHESQLYTYLKLARKPLGLILNFNTRQLKDGIKRIAMAQNIPEPIV